MSIFKATHDNIEKAAGIIRSGGLVVFPTETVYGLGADAFNRSAAAGIFEVKQRPFFDPLIVHISDRDDLSLLSRNTGREAERLMERFWPGPLTIVLEKKPDVPDIITSGLDTVAVRMPDHPVALELIRLAGTPVAAPSANRFGCLSPTAAEHVYSQMGDSVDMILDSGPCGIGVESTVVKIDHCGPVILRPGGTPAEEIEACLGRRAVISGEDTQTESPGQLPYHYSPEKPVVLAGTIPADINERYGYLFFRRPKFPYPENRAMILSETGDLREAAANLFSHLHKLDSMDIDVIYAEMVPETGLGRAIMDRLIKASKKSECRG